MEKELVCIACPIGCRVRISSFDEVAELRVSGNRCARGEVYAREEALAPKRVVTATVAVRHGPLTRLPVKTDVPLAKELIPALLDELYSMAVVPPMPLGKAIVENFKGTGVRVVATRTLDLVRAEET